MTQIGMPQAVRSAILASCALALACVVSCSGQSDAQDPRVSAPTGKAAAAAAQQSFKSAAIAELGMAEGWERAELVPGEVNTAGWEDSAYISRDGTTLYFQYFPGDMFRVQEVLKFHRPVREGGLGGDPAQFDTYHRGPLRGVNPPYTSDTFSVRLTGGGFRDVARFPYSRDGRNEWGVMQAEDGAFYYITHDPTRAMNRDIYRNDELLDIPGHEQYQEDNPHFAVTRYGRELFFDSDDRPASKGKSHIWVTREENGRYSEPVLLAKPVNVDGSTEVQPHLAADAKLYFTTSRDGVVAIHSSDRTGENSWGPAQPVLWPTKHFRPRLWGVGEPTLTADGSWLYCVVIFENERGEFDADVARVRRKEAVAAK